MGQYWLPVNLDKREYISPHALGAGLKLWEQLASHPGTGTALLILTAAMPEKRGGGDLDLDENWHGPERRAAMDAGEIDGGTPGPMPATYPAIAKRTIGRWAGDRIAIIGDYAEDSDLAPEHHASTISDHCRTEDNMSWTDITQDVCAVIAHELEGTFTGSGWTTFTWQGD